jgi:hypothetical protein
MQRNKEPQQVQTLIVATCALLWFMINHSLVANSADDL